LKEGTTITYRIPAGRYRVRVTSSNDGIKARWIGSSCSSSRGEQKLYEVTCDLSAEGQFVVENPTTLGLGVTENVTVRVTTR
jgi:hypothetical protein